MKSNHDLTTRDGFRSAIKDLREIPVLGQIYAPFFWIADKVFDFLEPGKAVEKQSKVAVDLIKAGKEQGAKRMKITMDERAGLHLDVPIEGVKVNVGAGSKGKVSIDIEYF